MAYVFTKNSTPTSGAVAVFNLKAALKASGWTVLKSSDGTTYNASGDQITTGTTGAGGMANVKAWFVIQQPGMSFGSQRSFVFQNDTATGTNWRIKYSLAGFLGGSPAALVVPSATDEVLLQGGGTDAAPSFTQMFPTSYGTTVPARQQIMVNDAAPYEFYSISQPQGGGDANQLMMLDVMAANTFDVLDVDPHVLYISYGSGSQLFGSSFFGSAGTSRAWFKKGLAGALFTAISASQYVFGSTSNSSFYLGVNAYNGKDVLLPIMFARVLSQGSAVGLKGQSTLMRWNSSARPTGDTISIVTTRDGFCALSDTPNCVVFPWDGSVPLV